MRRTATVALFMILWLLLDITAAAADPPGPTDYLGQVTEIDPELPGISIEIVGGDSFVVLVAEPGVTVDVIGYSGEPYLRYLPDGTVAENQLSPSRYLNEDRYAAAEVPADADAGAEPLWRVVASDGSYAWHDHRTHWMSSIKPPGRSPGDEVAEGVIPLFVDGVEVDVTVVSVWQEPPSALPIVLGVTVGLLVAFAAIRKREQVINAIVITASTAATIVGTVAYFSMPAETGPPWSLWALPATALVVGVVTVVRRTTMTAGSYRTLQMLGALELVLWGVLHWSWLWAALLPTRLPFWVDRFVSAGVLVGGIGAAIAVVLAATTPGRRVSFRP
jgi:hypothetical protein